MANEYFRGARKLKRRGITNREINQKKFPILLCIILIFKKKKKKKEADNIFRESHSHYTEKKKLVLHNHTSKYLLYQAHFYKYCTIYIRPTVLKNAAHPNAIFYLQ